MRVTVNSDDPAYFPGYMTENLIATQQGAQLGRNEIVQLTRNAFDCSWLQTDEKNELTRRLDTYLK